MGFIGSIWKAGGTPFNDYENIKDTLRTGDLLQWKTNSVGFWLYRVCVGSQYNHSSMVLRLPELEGGPEKRFTTDAHVLGGTAIKRLSKKLYSHRGQIWLYRLQDNISEEKRKEIGRKALQEIGKSYDLKSLLCSSACITFKRFALVKEFLPQKCFSSGLCKFCKADDTKLFCSEYMFFAYQPVTPAGAQMKFEEKRAPHPNDIIGLPLFTKEEKIFDSKTWQSRLVSLSLFSAIVLAVVGFVTVAYTIIKNAWNLIF